MPTSDNTIDLARVADETSVDAVHYLEQTPSTNDVAMSRAGQLANDHQELVITGKQLAGRGRGENRWWSGDGALTFSLITRQLSIERARTPCVSLAVGVGVCQAVESLTGQGRTQLKWPNDVYLHGRKVAGILIETPGGATGRFVVGVGLNVNNSLADAPQDVRSRATAMRDAVPAGFALADVLIETLNCIESCIALLEAKDPALPNMWRAASLLIGKRLRIVTPGGEAQGVCQTIADDGALVLKTAEGEIPCYGGAVDWFE